MQRSGAPPAGLGLDGEPLGSRVRVSRGGGGPTVVTGRAPGRRGRHKAAKNTRQAIPLPLTRAFFFALQASARGTDAERASQFRGPGG